MNQKRVRGESEPELERFINAFSKFGDICSNSNCNQIFCLKKCSIIVLDHETEVLVQTSHRCSLCRAMLCDQCNMKFFGGGFCQQCHDSPVKAPQQSRTFDRPIALSNSQLAATNLTNLEQFNFTK